MVGSISFCNPSAHNTSVLDCGIHVWVYQYKRILRFATEILGCRKYFCGSGGTGYQNGNSLGNDKIGFTATYTYTNINNQKVDNGTQFS